jgi:hypothetical protein
MKRQIHGLMINAKKQWPAEDLEERIEIGNANYMTPKSVEQISFRARGRVGLASEIYRRAVAEMAYDFWKQRGEGHGSSETDWYKAEAAVKSLWLFNLASDSQEGS